MTPRAEPPEVLRDVVEEHFDELDFLWELRQASLFRTGFRPLHLRRLEERMLAHLDGLLEAGPTGRDVARAALTADGVGHAAAAGWTLLCQSAPEANLVADALAAAKPEVAPGFAFALRHARFESWSPCLPAKLAALPEHVSSAWIDALAYHRRPCDPDLLESLVRSPDPLVRARAWQARARIGPALRPDELGSAAEDTAGEVRDAALRAAARWSTPGLLNRLRAAAARAGERDGEAILLLGGLGSAEDLPALTATLGAAPLALAALRALGALGRAEAIPLLIEVLDREDLSAAAGSAFEAITGESLRRAAASGADDDERLDSGEARAIWQRVRAQLSDEQRWRFGRPIETLELRQVLSEVDLDGARDAFLRRCMDARGDAVDAELESFARDRVR